MIVTLSGIITTAVFAPVIYGTIHDLTCHDDPPEPCAVTMRNGETCGAYDCLGHVS